MILETPLGSIEFGCSLGAITSVSGAELTYTVVPIEPQLPEGMEVQECTGILVRLVPQKTERDVRFWFRWLIPLEVPGNPESGERLEAQSWEARNVIVMVGTEDFDALVGRMPDFGLTEKDYPVTYETDGMVVNFPIIPCGARVSVHFVVAINPVPEPAEGSGWFAVDIPHNKLLAISGES